MNRLDIDPASIRVPTENEKVIVESLRDFIKRCPYLPDFMRCLNVDYLGADEDCFSIESVVADPVIQRYIDGSFLGQFQFYFSSREAYSMDVIQNIENSKFYELFSEWLRICSRERALPVLSSNRIAYQIFANTQGYVIDAQNGLANYMVQCTLRYSQAY